MEADDGAVERGADAGVGDGLGCDPSVELGEFGPLLGGVAAVVELVEAALGDVLAVEKLLAPVELALGQVEVDRGRRFVGLRLP